MLYLARKGSAEAAPAFRQASNLSAGHPMKKVLMYSTRICPYCQAAERLLKSRGVERIEKILVDENPALREQMIQRTGLKTVPQIFIGDMYVGGMTKWHSLIEAASWKNCWSCKNLFTICDERRSAKEDGAQEPEHIDICEDSEHRPTQAHGRAVRS